MSFNVAGMTKNIYLNVFGKEYTPGLHSCQALSFADKNQGHPPTRTSREERRWRLPFRPSGSD